MPYRQINRKVKVAGYVAFAALTFSIAANLGTSLQAYHNCKEIELIKANTRAVLSETYQSLLAGDMDEAYQKLYGEEWPIKKKEAIVKAQERIHRFDENKCSFVIH